MSIPAGIIIAIIAAVSYWLGRDIGTNWFIPRWFGLDRSFEEE